MAAEITLELDSGRLLSVEGTGFGSATEFILSVTLPNNSATINEDITSAGDGTWSLDAEIEVEHEGVLTARAVAVDDGSLLASKSLQVFTSA